MNAPLQAKAIQINAYGPPENLCWVDVSLDPLAANEVRFKVLAAAVNHADLEICSGNWPVQLASPFPYTPDLEALGDVWEVHAIIAQSQLKGRALLLP